MDIRVFKENEKLQEAYEKILDNVEGIIHDYQLSYFEIFGIMKCVEVDLTKSNIMEGEEE